MGLPGHNILNGTVQLGTVIKARAQHDLGMILHIGRLQLVQLAHEPVSCAAPEHFPPQIRVGALDRNKQRREMVLLDSLKICIHHIGKGDKIAIEEGHAIVVILDVQAVPHIRSHLVHKAEITVIGTVPDTIKHRRLKLYSQLLVIILVKFQDFLLSVGMLNEHFHFLAGHGKAHINNVPQPHAVDFQNLVPRHQLQLLCQAILRHRQYFTTHFHCSSYLLPRGLAAGSLFLVLYLSSAHFLLVFNCK